MKPFAVSAFLRVVLLADAAATGIAACAMLFASTALAGLFHLPAALVQGAGAILVPYAALVAYLASRQRLQPAAVWTIIACNVLWAVDSVALALSGWIAPSPVGYAFILAQTVMVVGFAELQYVGLRRSTGPQPAFAH